MNINALQFFIGLLFFFILFSSCDLIERKESNGVSSAKYRVRGQIIDALSGKPVNQIKTVLGELYEYEGSKRVYYIDSINTNERGEFDVYIVRSPSYVRFVLKIEEVKLANTFQHKVDTIDFNDVKFLNGSGWYKGEAIRELGQVKILLKST